MHFAGLFEFVIFLDIFFICSYEFPFAFNEVQFEIHLSCKKKIDLPEKS